LVRRHEILDDLPGTTVGAGSALFAARMAATDIETGARDLIAFQRYRLILIARDSRQPGRWECRGAPDVA